MALSTMIGNVQVLYESYYEIINMPVLLGTVIFSSTFLVNNLINEKYGKKMARQSVVLSFIAQIFFIVNVLLTIGHTPISNDSANVKSIVQIFLPLPRILIASYIAYLTSQLVQVYLYRAIKITNQFVKNNLSLFISSIVVDTMVFTGVAFVVFADTALSTTRFWQLCATACLTRVFCNFVNSVFLRKFIA